MVDRVRHAMALRDRHINLSQLVSGKVSDTSSENLRHAFMSNAQILEIKPKPRVLSASKLEDIFENGDYVAACWNPP